MKESVLNNIVGKVIASVLNEGEFKPGDSVTIPGGETLGAKIIRAKYNMQPEDFEYVGEGKWIYKAKLKKSGMSKKNPKFKQDLSRKEGESYEEYLSRVREVNPKFTQAEEEIPGEEWRPVVNKGRFFKGEAIYEMDFDVSNMGRVRIVNYEDPMKSRITSGYDAPGKKARNVHLDVPGFKTTPPIHTIVADAWLPEPEGGIEKYDVIHIDGDYHNNRADNLKYVPKSERRKRNNNSENITEPMKESIKRLVRENVRSILMEESTKRDLYDTWEKIKYVIGEDEMLNEVFNYFSYDQLQAFLESLSVDYDLDYLFNDDDGGYGY